jgi:hypothetical protein
MSSSALVASLGNAPQSVTGQNPPPRSPKSKHRQPWFHGLTLDQQDAWLDQNDPNTCPPGRQPLPTRWWNRQKDRIRRLREPNHGQIDALRRPCHCKRCRQNRRPPFPRYYVANGISYECWLEQQTAHPELEFILTRLRNDRPRLGSAFLHRRPK